MKLFRLVSGITIGMISCVEPYDPPIKSESVNMLVVDGFLNTSDNYATVRLSRAVPLNSDMPVSEEVNATVNIEDENGSTFPLNNIGLGIYFADNLGLDQSKKHRVHIYSLGGVEYVSDYVGVTNTPPIDSVVWKPTRGGLSIYVNTHDPAGQSRYYDWTFDETWEYTSSFYSTYKIVDREAVPRPRDEQIFVCWSSERSTQILLGSTDRLSEDVVRDFPITYIPAESSKLGHRYSIEVQQRVLTKEEYDFRLQLQKTTESLGGLFDPMPSQVPGNIGSTSPDSPPALGYFSAGSVAKQRIFIKFAETPDYVRAIYRPRFCSDPAQYVTQIPVEQIPNTPSYVLLIDPIFVQGVGIVAYTTAQTSCIDCRWFGGTNKQPDFW